MEVTIQEATDKIISLYAKWGASDYIGESVTQTQHALQCASMATRDSRLRDYDDFIWKCVVVAALLHDIGHLVGMESGDMEMRNGDSSLGIIGHEGIGAAYLRECGMPSLVCELVASHVASKRYLCTVREDYYNRLSEASKATMVLQGGKMSTEEIVNFRSSRMSELKIYLREYDDCGKDVGGKDSSKDASKDSVGKDDSNYEKKINGIESYRGMIESVLLGGRFFV